VSVLRFVGVNGVLCISILAEWFRFL